MAEADGIYTARNPSQGPSPIDRDEEGDGVSGKLTELPKSCLWFCLVLLGQIVKAEEYESPLVCGLALLGVTAGGWRDPKTIHQSCPP